MTEINLQELTELLEQLTELREYQMEVVQKAIELLPILIICIGMVIGSVVALSFVNQWRPGN